MKPLKIKIYVLTIVFFALLFLPLTLNAENSRANKSDEEIIQEVQQKIKSNLFYTVFDWITVKTDNGNVTLDGYVHLPWDKNYFVKFAKEVDGVKSVVDNTIKINGPDDLRYMAMRAIYSDSMFEHFGFLNDPPVHVIVISNKIILEGTVQSDLEREWAGRLVEWHTDAGNIENNLVVEKS